MGASDPASALWFKGTPRAAAGGGLAALPALGLALLRDDLALPAAVLKRSALDHNERWIKAFLARQGVDFAPHGKTTMSPEIIRGQLRDGAWAITAATAHHVRLYAQWGVTRILMANQLVGRANLDIVAGLLADRPELDFYCLVDSTSGVELLADAAARAGLSKPINVLIELGSRGERAGVRDTAEALAVARACHSSGGRVRLCGVETFEGVFSEAADATRLLDALGSLVRTLSEAGLLAGEELVVSAGGSYFPDLAAKAMLASNAGRPARLVVRSGCSVTHDAGHYDHAFDLMVARSPELAALGRLKSALEVWAHVQSRPEPGLVIASLGKRDIGADVRPPTPLWRCRIGEAAPSMVGEGVSLLKLYDQHACIAVPPDCDLAVGDLMGFGQSHPCTTFDKWRALFVVDDDYVVRDVVRTFF